MQEKNPFSLPKVALIQLILFIVYFFVNMYSFFSDEETEGVISVILILMLIIFTVGFTGILANKKKLFQVKNFTTLEILSIVAIGLLTAISLLGSISGILVFLIV